MSHILAAYLILSLVLSPGSSVGNISPHHIGAALTFSAGTFIFVAMHAVNELTSASADEDTEGGNAPSSKPILGRIGRTSTFIIGSILPKGLQMVVGH